MQTQKNSKKGVRVKKRTRVVARSRRRNQTSSGIKLDPFGAAYRNLLLDPCHAAFAAPPVSGPSSGLFVRQRYVVDLTTTNVTVGATPPATPDNTPSVFMAALRPAIGTLELTVRGTTGSGGANAVSRTVPLETGILTSARSYRCLAGCMRFVPTGPIGTRSGSVSIGYIPDRLQSFDAGAGVGFNATQNLEFATNLFRMGQRTMGNGSSSADMIETKWIPSGPEDLDFKDKSFGYNGDSGTCFAVGLAMDGTGSGTSGQLNGYLDITLVWEWIPNYDSGVVTSIQPTSTNTLQQVLSTMGELGRTVTDAAYAAAQTSAGKAMLRMGANALMGTAMSYMAGPVANYRPGIAM